MMMMRLLRMESAKNQFSDYYVSSRADHPSKESYRLSLIKKLRKLSPKLQKREQAPKCRIKEEEKNGSSEVG
jgi:hypothetical protein